MNELKARAYLVLKFLDFKYLNEIKLHMGKVIDVSLCPWHLQYTCTVRSVECHLINFH